MQIYYIIRVHPVSGTANYQSKLSQSILKHAAFWDILSLTITDSFLQAKRTLHDPEMTSQIRRGLAGVRTWSHTRWCFFFFFLICICTRWIWQPLLANTHKQSRRFNACTSAILSKEPLRNWQKVKNCRCRALPFSICLHSSNDVHPKMSDQLAVLHLTFNWQIGKQTHTEEHVVLWTPGD